MAMSGLSSTPLAELKVLGAEALLLGSVSWTGAALEVDVRLVDVSSGKVLAAAGRSVRDYRQLRSVAGDLAHELGSKLP